MGKDKEKLWKMDSLTYSLESFINFHRNFVNQHQIYLTRFFLTIVVQSMIQSLPYA